MGGALANMGEMRLKNGTRMIIQSPTTAIVLYQLLYLMHRQLACELIK